MKKAFTSKTAYNFKQLRNVFAKPDYFHSRLSCRESGVGLKESYYLDFRSKADFPGEFVDGIPILNYYGHMIFFPVTVANYFLGLLESPFDLSMKNDFVNLFNWYIDNTKEHLVQHKFDEKNFKNKAVWYSGLAQAMFLSVFIRATAKGYFQKSETDEIIEGLYQSFQHPAIASKTLKGFVEEYPVAENRVLNGYLFVVFAYYDYFIYTGDRMAFDQSLNIVLKEIDKYRMGIYWSFYDINIISSPFYHNLHIDMLRALFLLTSNEKLAHVEGKFRIGNKIKLIYLSIKVFQKLFW